MSIFDGLEYKILIGMLLIWLSGIGVGLCAPLVFPRLLRRGRFNALHEAYVNEIEKYRTAAAVEIRVWQERLHGAELDMTEQRTKYESMLDDERARCDKDRDEMMRIMNDLRANIEQAQEVRQTQLLASEDAILELELVPGSNK